jgi:hypothetical protein
VAEWQTRRSQKPMRATSCGFDSRSRHQYECRQLSGGQGSPRLPGVNDPDNPTRPSRSLKLQSSGSAPVAGVALSGCLTYGCLAIVLILVVVGAGLLFASR